MIVRWLCIVWIYLLNSGDVSRHSACTARYFNFISIDSQFYGFYNADILALYTNVARRSDKESQ
jgi:hypothetical protein